MKNISVLFLLALFLFACNEDESNPEAKLFMTFDPRFNGEYLPLGDVHTNIHGYPFYATDIKFYISNIRLHSAEGDDIDLSSIELISIEENRQSLEYIVPEGNYIGLSYSLGVPSEMNGTNDPDFSTSQYPVGHPLNELSSGMYWQWASGYRFFTFEGRFDLEPNSSPTLPLSFAFHTGTDTLFREVAPFQKDMNLEPGGTFVMSFAVDIDSIFTTTADTINLAEVSSFHGSENQIQTGIKLANNMSKSFVLK